MILALYIYHNYLFYNYLFVGVIYIYYIYFLFYQSILQSKKGLNLFEKIDRNYKIIRNLTFVRIVIKYSSQQCCLNININIKLNLHHLLLFNFCIIFHSFSYIILIHFAALSSEELNKENHVGIVRNAITQDYFSELAEKSNFYIPRSLK